MTSNPKCEGCPVFDDLRPWFPDPPKSTTRACPLTEEVQQSPRSCSHRVRFEAKKAAYVEGVSQWLA